MYQKVTKINPNFVFNIKNSHSLDSLLEKLREKNHYTYQHSLNVYMYSISIGEKLKLKTTELKQLGQGALLHDIGKLKMSDKILKKPDSLTELEYQKIKKHPIQGVKIIGNNKNISNLKTAILEHHENFDGSGYPFGLSGENIALNARIIRIADSFDTMVSNRVYQSALPIEKAITELKENAGQQFDPEIVKSFAELILD